MKIIFIYNIDRTLRALIIKHAGVFLSGFRPDKTHAASFLNGFKNIPQKARVLGVR